MKNYSIQVSLTEEQVRNLNIIVNEQNPEEMRNNLEEIFNYALLGMGSSMHAEDASEYYWTIVRAKQLATVLLQEGFEIFEEEEKDHHTN